ncbi:MAG TPA: proline racemase family protein [Acidobacteriaceae bacterium]|nr:proline racemase family protein [Acidobacteriaceae bacterium]
MTQITRIRVIDSHTGGEPTRIVLPESPGVPALGAGTMTERLEHLRTQHDRFRAAVVEEPRGSDVLVGGLLQTPLDPQNAAGILFFNNVGYLGMCGHGTIGLVATLAYLGRMRPGRYGIETPVGTVQTELHSSGQVTVENVPSHRAQKAVKIAVPGYGAVTGDVAWGGNWFFLVDHHATQDSLQLDLKNVAALTQFTAAIRQALSANHITGDTGAEIDHIELFAPSPNTNADSRNFVLCPGMAYDRSPCGTGTSAKLACLHADGKLQPDAVWRQESITGSVFEGAFSLQNGKLLPRITGSAFITADAELLLDPRDPFCMGMRR